MKHAYEITSFYVSLVWNMLANAVKSLSRQMIVNNKEGRQL